MRVRVRACACACVCVCVIKSRYYKTGDWHESIEREMSVFSYTH